MTERQYHLELVITFEDGGVAHYSMPSFDQLYSTWVNVERAPIVKVLVMAVPDD